MNVDGNNPKHIGVRDFSYLCCTSDSVELLCKTIQKSRILSNMIGQLISAMLHQDASWELIFMSLT